MQRCTQNGALSHRSCGTDGIVLSSLMDHRGGLYVPAKASCRNVTFHPLCQKPSPPYCTRGHSDALCSCAFIKSSFSAVISRSCFSTMRRQRHVLLNRPEDALHLTSYVESESGFGSSLFGRNTQCVRMALACSCS